jgi:pimeloyl-ACP methyl ester carboxylesterase
MVGYRGVEGTVKLACPELGRLMKAHTGKDLFSEEAQAQYQALANKCAAGFQAAGIDLSGYTIPDVIQDMEAARIALGYDKIDLFSESYGTRVAQIYAYMHPEVMHRVVQIGVNTPGHFLYSPSTIDEQIRYLSKLCAKDASCSDRTSDFAQTMYEVNHNMPKRWLFLPIDPDSVRLGTQFLLFANKDIATIADVYLAAGEGDPSGLAMANLIMHFAIPSDGGWVMGEYFAVGGTADMPKYGGVDSISLGNSIMGAPLSELIWPTASQWPLELIPKELREFQESDVDMLLINGTVDFSTPPVSLDEARPYWHKAQMVLLPEFSHVGDEYSLQQAAFERLITSYYDTGVADSSLYVYEPLSFKPAMSMTVLAKLLVAAMIVLPALILLIIVLVVRRIRRRRAAHGITM